MITLAKTHLFSIQQHAKDVYPHECCGAMIGHNQKELKKVTKIVRIKNHSSEDKRRRFKITSEDYQFVEKLALQHSLDLLGFYHSHPDHPAIPSKTDEKYAWPFFSYIILSINKMQPQECYSYLYDFSQQSFQQEDLIIENGQ